MVGERVELDELEHLLDALAAARAVPAQHLERQPDVLRHRAPVEEHGVLEDDPVVAVEPRLRRGLAVDGDDAARRRHQVADHAQQRRLAAAGRPDQRDELAGPDVEVDVLERGDVRRAGTSSSAPTVTTLPLALMRRSPARAGRRASRPARRQEEDDPERRGDDVRRPQVPRLERVVLVEVEDRPAEPVLEDDGSSPMIAPTTHAVAATRKRREQERQRRPGRAASRARPTLRGVRAHQLDARGSADCSPRSVLIVTGKNVRYAAITATAPQPSTAPAASGPDDDHRRDREDRDRLRRDDVRHEPALEQPRVDEHDGEDEAERGAEREADRGLLRRHERRLARAPRSAAAR